MDGTTKSQFMMKLFTIARMMIGTFLTVPAAGQHQTAVLDLPITGGLLPYEITLREIQLAPATLPNLHSMIVGVWDDQWVLFAGRTNGLHGMTGNNAFDPQFENREVWVIDPSNRQSWRKSWVETSPSSGLTADQVDSLSCVNAQFHQSGSSLIVVGGYGYKRSVADHKTYDTLTAIELPGLVAWVKQAPGAETTTAAQHVRQIRDAYFQVTGGSLEKIGAEYQLVMGQNYDGRYRPNLNGVYTQQVRRFLIDEGAGPLTVPPASKIATPPLAAYRRRDLNVATMLQAGAVAGTYEERVVVLSGVFTPANGVWTVPVVIGPGGSVTMNDPTAPDTLRQAFQIYHSAKVGMFHRATREMHVFLFGGLTLLEHDPVNGGFTRDDQVPFTNQCGVVVRGEDGKFRQYFTTTRFPLIKTTDGKELRFGTNAEFFPAPTVPKLHSKVLDLALIDHERVIGHVFGGIVADAGNGGATGASGRVFEVVLTPRRVAPKVSIAMFPEEVGLQWTGMAGERFLVEKSEDLTTWEEVSEPVAGVGVIYWNEPRTDPAAFYRVLTGEISRAAAE